ncbi:MAG: Flp family type IVb pilin [Alphaproteobacteria bacterium]|nr:Flp family type IVb pilin [Alphaproteobacteria bacterium]
MLKLLALRDAYLRDEDGATAIEYGLMVAAIALAIVALVFTLGDRIEAGFQGIDDGFSSEGL